MPSPTRRLTTRTCALSLGLLLAAPLALAQEAPPPAFPHWTQAQIVQKANELWARWGLTPAQRHQISQEMQQWWQANWNPEQRQQYWEQIRQTADDLWTRWGLTPAQRQQYSAQLQAWWNDLGTAVDAPGQTPATARALAAVAPVMAVLAVAATPPTATPATAADPSIVDGRVQFPFPWYVWGLTAEQRQQYWAPPPPPAAP